jgi:hypothetical protein
MTQSSSQAKGKDRCMSRVVHLAWLLLILVSLSSLPVTVLHASTAPGGTAIDVPAVNDASATVWNWGTKGVGMTMGLVLGLGGLGKLGTRAGRGLGMIGAGAGTALLPFLISGVYQATPAATHAPGVTVAFPLGVLPFLWLLQLFFDPSFVFFVMLGLLVHHLRTPRMGRAL